MTITTDSFDFVADLVRRRSAIQLDRGKEYLVESRLAPLARQAGVDVDQFVRQVRTARREADFELVVEALTTNETSWFRDAAPFEALRSHVVPTLMRERSAVDRLRLWSAACSTGQEAYSIVMTLTDLLPPSVTVEVLATDLSTQVLDRARSGSYTQLEVNRGLPAAMLVRHLQRVGAAWQVSDAVRRPVTFARHNLLDAPPAGPPFDIVFLRNVLIYFDLPTKRSILGRIRRVLRPDGFLILGAAESTLGVDSAWERVPVNRGAVYRPAPPGAPSPVQARPVTTTASVGVAPTTFAARPLIPTQGGHR
jgi:chemotaxis protein methyltransferase CheR